MSKEKLLINNPKSNNSEAMSNKQIEEMAKDVWKASCAGRDIPCHMCKFADMKKDSYSCLDYVIAEGLYTAGYRKQKWISVDERLPDTNEKVLVCYSNGSMDVAKYIRADGYAFWFEEATFFRNITHWMPLPEAPKGGKAEEEPKKYFTPEDVRKMSQSEVRYNYKAIMDSMKEWK